MERPIPITYEEAGPRMRAGDVIAFGGRGPVSDLVRLVTRSAVTHVGVVLKAEPAYSWRGQMNWLIESTSLDGRSGVTMSRISTRVASYDGDIWWLPLADDVRARLDEEAFFEFLLAQREKPYDYVQAAGAGIDLLDRVVAPGRAGRNTEDLARLFCSELVAAALEAGGVLRNINASEVTPIDLCRWKIYSPEYYLLTGDSERVISRFNSVPPADVARAA